MNGFSDPTESGGFLTDPRLGKQFPSFHGSARFYIRKISHITIRNRMVCVCIYFVYYYAVQQCYPNCLLYGDPQVDCLLD